MRRESAVGRFENPGRQVMAPGYATFILISRAMAVTVGVTGQITVMGFADTLHILFSKVKNT